MTNEIERKFLLGEGDAEFSDNSYPSQSLEFLMAISSILPRTISGKPSSMRHRLSPLKDAALALGNLIDQGYVPVERAGKIRDYINGEMVSVASTMQIDAPKLFSYSFKPKEARLRRISPRGKDRRYFFTVKGPGNLERPEEEIEINEGIYDAFWPLTEGKRIQKCRLSVPYKGRTVEIDAYVDRHLLVAEVEFPDTESSLAFPKIGLEVTTVKAYKNINLAR